MELKSSLDEQTGAVEESSSSDQILTWLENVLPRVVRRLMDSENLDSPLLQLPLAQMRLANALYGDSEEAIQAGETMGRLSERLCTRNNALTQAADRLIGHGLAERIPDPHDRRIVRLRLTEKGREWVAARRARRRAHLSRLLDMMKASERREFLEAVRTLNAICDRLTDILPPGFEGKPTETRHAASPVVEETFSRFVAGDLGGKPPAER